MARRTETPAIFSPEIDRALARLTVVLMVLAFGSLIFVNVWRAVVR